MAAVYNPVTGKFEAIASVGVGDANSDTLTEIDGRINTLETANTTNTAAIADHETRIAALEV